MRRFHDGITLLWFLCILKLFVASVTIAVYFFIDCELVVDHEHWSHLAIFVLQTVLLYTAVKTFYYSIRLSLISLFPPSNIVHIYLLFYLLLTITSLLGILYRKDTLPEVKYLEIWFAVLLTFCLVKIAEGAASKWQLSRFKAYLSLQNTLANVEITDGFVYLNYQFLFANRAFGRKYRNDSTLESTLIYEYVRLRRYSNLLQRIGSTSSMPAKLMIHNDLLGEITNHINFLLLKDRSLKRFDQLTDYQLLEM
ncbi:unnamed protein product [Bursaphelenchus xylophilus]|uniref:(pine wood nematode) hypothetical protein n=1 Tax=Bursaphelenchus xylophilus TaxID=6326 RepID=A0A1I7RMJ1_BURXY|nr:unnamed protein product [Bursaphelenchus xylophilus]CAG9118544.1 unnamed protein product [Bursaphelenchus xylophilus]